MANAIWTRDNVKVEVGDWVVMGEDDDREAGRVVEIEGGKALIAWHQGTCTWEACETADVYTSRSAALQDMYLAAGESEVAAAQMSLADADDDEVAS